MALRCPLIDRVRLLSCLFFTVLLTLPAHVLCPLQRCPVMSAGPQYEYLWADGIKVKTPLKLSSPDYINCLFDWVEDQVGGMVAKAAYKSSAKLTQLSLACYSCCPSLLPPCACCSPFFLLAPAANLPPCPPLQLDNPAIFPQRYGGSFPPNFTATVRNILKRLFRVYGHIYHSHFRQAAGQGACRKG